MEDDDSSQDRDPAQTRAGAATTSTTTSTVTSSSSGGSYAFTTTTSSTTTSPEGTMEVMEVVEVVRETVSKDKGEVVVDEDKFYEREDVQKKTFAKWINSQLVKGNHPLVTDLFYDLRDGTRLLALLEVLTGSTYKREKGKMRVHHLNNVSRGLSILEQHNVKLVNISNDDIVDGSAKLTLGLVWSIILHWQVQGVLKDVMADLQQTNLEKTLLAWCRQTTKGYHGVDVRNFTTSWTDGLAFNALIHRHRPDLFDWPTTAKKLPFARLEQAFRLANKEFGIERLLDPEDVNTQVPDKKSMMMYIMCLFQALPKASFTMDSLDVSIQSDSSFSLEASGGEEKSRPLSTVSIGLGGYQRTLEEVLTWLLGAEDRLAAMPPIADEPEEVKQQFHQLEDLMLELTAKQGGIGDVLGEGTRLLREGVMGEEEEEEIRVQMKLLNTRWEDLRVKAMDRQTQLHDCLMQLQQSQLENLKSWLTATEDRISNMSEVGPTTEDLRAQVAAHHKLQQDLEGEQTNINSLSNMVVVVDEGNSDAAYSNLEDELNALGERWAHICRWAEQRWTTLQVLTVHWEQLEREMEKLGKWLDENEAQLKQMESNPSTDQEHLLRQAGTLQVLQSEMEIQQRRFALLQEESSKVLSNLPKDSPAQTKIPETLENLQDRWDCLVAIIEAQNQRLAASGIDIKRTVVPSDTDGGIVSSSTSTITHEGASMITKVITTKTTITKDVEEGSFKRQKLEGESYEEFNVALNQLGGWMDTVQDRLQPKQMDDMSYEQLVQLCQHLQDEVRTQQEEYNKVMSLGQSAISETSTIGESSSDSESKVTDFAARWQALSEMMANLQSRIEFMTERKKLTTELSAMEIHYQGFQRWFDTVRTVSENEPNAITTQVEQCKTKISAMKNHEQRLREMNDTVNNLSSKWPTDAAAIVQLGRDFIDKWEALLLKLVDWGNALSSELEKQPPQSYLEALAALKRWLTNVEAAVTTEPLVISKLPILNDQLQNYKELLKTVEVEESSLAYINRTGNELISRSEVNARLKGDLVELNKRWESAVAALKSRVENVEKAIEMLGQYRDEVSGLKSWLADVDVFLHAEDAAIGDIETLEAQLEQSNALQDDISTLETNVNNIKTTSGHIIQETNDEELRNEVSQQLKDLSDRWDVVLDLAKRQNKSLKEALAKSQKVHEDISKLNTWLDKLELEFPAVKPIETSSELSNVIEVISKLREDIAKHTDTFRSVNEIGNEMLQYENVTSHDDMARQFTQLNGRWTDIVSQIDGRHKTLTNAAEQYAQFQVLCEEETSWLDQLEQKLEKSSKSAADAEEISEALDDLEIFLHGHHEERLQKVQELAEQLVQEGVMTFAVQNSTHDLTSRFNTLNAQANEQRTTLEGGVQEAQAWEREYISVLEWLTHTDVVITQAVADPSTHLEGTDEVLKELSRQQEVLTKMEDQVQVYQTSGKLEAAQRLEDQVVHLRKKYEEVQGKLQQLNAAPSDFDARLKSMDAQLRNISQSVQLVSLVAGNPDAIQEQLNHCLQLYRTLSEVKGEVESVIATGRKIVKENQTSNPEGLTQQLDQLKALYNELGKAVTEQRGILEQSLRQSKKVLKDGQHLEDWLSSTEHELDTREATVPLRSVQHELHFAQHALEDLGRKKPLLTGLQESYVTLSSLCGSEEQLLPLRERIDDIALTWERVYTRLCNRLQSMESEQDRKKDEMEKFIVGLGEVKGWLEVTENKLSNLTRYPADERASIIKKVSQEVKDYKGQIENIRDTSVELISHGELFESRVQPELVNINQRWEHIFKTVTKQEAETVVPDTQVETQKEVIQKVSSLPSTSKTVTSMMTKTTITSSYTSSTAKDFQKEQTSISPQVVRPDEDQVDLYLREVSSMSDKITALKYKTKDIPHFNEAKEKVEGLEHEVALLEPDVATVISRGDTLTLTTHMVDVPRANSIRLAVNDLRQQWSTLKADTEHLKNDTDLVNREIENYPEKVDVLITWLNEVTKRLDLVNNDESQLEALEREMASKKEEIDKINETGELMKKYQYIQLQPILTLINTRWTELTMQFRQYRKVPHETKTIVPGSKDAAVVEPSKVPDYVASVNRLREAISAISRQLNAPLMNGKQFDNLNAQEEELKIIKQGLDTLKPRVDNTETEREAVMSSAMQSEADQVRRVVDKLRQEWAQVNRGYTEHHARWLHSTESLRSLHKMTEDFSVWLSSIEEKVQVTTSQPLPEAKITQKDLEKQVTLKHRPSQNLQTKCKEITEEMNVEDGRRLQDRVDNLMKRWRALLLDLAARRERIATEETGKDTSTDYEGLVTWVDQAQALMDAPVNVTDEASLSAHITMVQNHVVECGGKQILLKRLKDAKPKGVTPAQIVTLETNMTKIAHLLPEYKFNLDTKQGVIKTLGDNVEDLYKWTEEMRVRVAMHNFTQDELKQMRATLREKTAWYESLDSTYWVLAQDAESKGLTVSVTLKNRMNSIESRLKALQAQLTDSSSSSGSPSTSFGTAAPGARESGGDEQENKKKVIVEAEVEAVKEDDMASSMSSSVTSSVTTVIHNVKMEESVLSTEGDMRPPSPLVCPPKHSPDSSPAVVLASLDKSILQIRDWLTLVEQMVKQQTAVVGDSDDIRSLIEKQKSVLRELESKKPQLDELVASADSLKDDASRTQLHQKVSKLREHWDETNSSVLQRKTQLDVMMADTHKFDVKRAEVETWLSRLEARMERMAPVAHTADILDQQIREQKGIHAELHQYKHQMELFNQMTQRLITIYQHDDTRKIKKITETINMRYSNLSSSIIARGKVLHSAMNSLHNFDKALDKFRAWLSETESLADQLDMEVDKLGPGRRDMQPRGPSIHLKDLQSEIESHKDVLASLNATGQKLLGTLDNQDEAVMLQRRLEEMNQRWNNLKHKSMAIRNRLEGNAENWNSLLLSLRELIEWVIRKDTELNALGPLVGDISALTKYEEDLTVFRRVLDEKQPVIESNLKSGRQLIASEPPLSDTSDSEAGRDLDGDNRYRGEETARDLTRSVRREVAKLSEKWAALRERAGATASQANLANKKLGVLQKTVEEVGGRLEEAEKTVSAWGTVPQDPNLADQHVHNVKKFREGLADLQRGVDDVNDQAARFSAHNVPLTPANSARLHDLNNRWKTLETTVNDRWRQLAGRSREVTPMTPAQLASSVSPPWERATASNKVPYYINHDRESTHWDHPDMMELLDSMAQYNHIKFSAYRTAMKLRTLQKKLALEYAKLQTATGIFDEHGLRGQNDRLIDVNDMVVVLSALYASIASDHPEVNTTLAMDLCLNWLLNVYDSQRTGQMRVLSFKVGLVCLCTGHLEEKYRYMFRLIADLNRLVDQRKLGLLLHDCVQVPRQLGEVAAFGGSNIEPSVRSCFTKAGKDRETIEAVHFLSWVQQEPQSLVWLAVLHRVAASENVHHQVKCNICKAYPVVGLRYRCLKCLSFDMCQQCFFGGRSNKSHKVTHPMHEYCTATTTGEDMKDFTKALKNKFKSKRSLQKHAKKGYLPVQTVLEGDALESPAPSPQHNVSSQDMHTRLEMYASRLAEVELRTNSNSTPDSEDEHGLIAQYCQSLSSSDAPLPVPRSPLQIMAAVDAEQKEELEAMIRDLEEENKVLQAEYDRLKAQKPVGSPPEDFGPQGRSETDMIAEAKLLREHKGRLEARMSILEEHNRQLEAQLHRLRQLLEEPSGASSPNKSGTLQTKSVTASQLAMDSPAKVNGHSTAQGGSGGPYEGLEQMSEYVRPPPPPLGSMSHVGNLFSRAGDLGKAVGTLVATMTDEGEKDSRSSHHTTDDSE